MNKIIIAISGDKAAGKDTTATMLEYIMAVGIQRATYAEWYRTYQLREYYKTNVLHFADKLKDICSQITNLPKRYFNNHQYKDEWWWIYGTDSFIGEEMINSNEHRNTENNEKIEYYKIEAKNKTISEELRIAKYSKKIPIIKLRTILQFIGTEMFREMYDIDYWTNSTLYNVKEILKDNDFCIISDLRFKAEIDKLKKLCRTYKDTLYIINVGYSDKFEKNITERELHISEKRLDKFDYYICNKKENFYTLFVKVLQCYQQLILK